MIPILFLKEETRLAILGILINIYKNRETYSIYGYDCVGFDYIEKVAIRFDLFEKLGEADSLNIDYACNVLSKEKCDNYCFFRDLVQYFLTTEYNKNIGRAKGLWGYEPPYIRKYIFDKICKDLRFGVDGYLCKDPLEHSRFYNIDNSSQNNKMPNNDIYYKDL